MPVTVREDSIFLELPPSREKQILQENAVRDTYQSETGTSCELNLEAWGVGTFAPCIKQRRYNSYSGKIEHVIEPLHFCALQTRVLMLLKAVSYQAYAEVAEPQLRKSVRSWKFVAS